MSESKVPGKDATREEIEAYMRSQLTDLKKEADYLHESAFTLKWTCIGCGSTGIPCSIPCPQCGHNRPEINWDKETEGKDGEMREKAKKAKRKRRPLF